MRRGVTGLLLLATLFGFSTALHAKVKYVDSPALSKVESDMGFINRKRVSPQGRLGDASAALASSHGRRKPVLMMSKFPETALKAAKRRFNLKENSRQSGRG